MRNCPHFVTYVCDVILRLHLANTNIGLFEICTRALVRITTSTPFQGFCSPRLVRNEKPCGPKAVQQAVFVFPKLDVTSVMRNLCRMRNSAPQRQTSYSRGAGSCRRLLEMKTSSFWFLSSFDFCSRWEPVSTG